MQKKYNDTKEIKIVSEIFQKAGMEYIANLDLNTIKDIKTDIDILAIYKNVIILVECVGADKFGKKLKKAISDFSIIIKDFDKIKNLIKTSHRDFYKKNKEGLEFRNKVFKKLLISFNRITKETVTEAHLKLLTNNETYLWTEEEMYYYDVVSDCTYDHCRYEIFDHLELKPEKLEKKGYLGPLVYLAYGREVDVDLYLLNLIVPVRVLLGRSSVRRLRNVNTEDGYQRLLNKKKLKKMRKYLLKERSLYPNNIICRLDNDTTIKKSIDDIKLTKEDKAKTVNIKKEVKEKLFIVELPNIYDIFEIIDGQHRLFSYAQTKYHLFERIKNKKKNQVKKDDKKIEELSGKSYLTVTAIYSQNKQWADPGKLFLDINTTQTKIIPEDVIDLMEKFYPQDPIAIANRLLKRINKKSVLANKIKTKFWQKEKIKRTSLIKYSGLKNMFIENNKSYKIFKGVYDKQNKIKNYEEFCFILINNFLHCISNLIEKKDKKKLEIMMGDLMLKNYYFFSAVFLGAFIRFLRHFLSDKDKEFNIAKKINKVIVNGLKNNVENKNLQKLFNNGLKLIVEKYDFTKQEFDKKGWSSNRWAQIEADLLYTVRDNGYPDFGDESLISKDYIR